MSFYDQSLGVPEEIARKALDLKIWMETFNAKSVYGMGDVVDAHRQLADLQRQLDDMTAERDAWKGTHDGLHRVYRDIGEALGADMPRELVNDVARRRMEEIETLKAEIALLNEELLLAQKGPEC